MKSVLRPPDLHIDRYGTHGPRVIVLHGGPAAVGSAAPIARGLAHSFRVWEPWQRRRENTTLGVAAHVADLHNIVRSLPDDRPPALVGESWGAMLALAFAAEHPEAAGPCVLVAGGTWDADSRNRYRATIEARITDDMRRQLAELHAEGGEDDLEAQYDIIRPAYDYDALREDPLPHAPPFDRRGHQETWNDMLRLQHQGVYPAAFAAVRAPVLMIHGDYDPHPGPMIRDSLLPYIPHLEYRELAACGHSPWRERAASDSFFALLRAWLLRHGG